MKAILTPSLGETYPAPPNPAHKEGRVYRIEASRSCSSQLGRKKSDLLLRNEKKAGQPRRETGRLAGQHPAIRAGRRGQSMIARTAIAKGAEWIK